MRNAALLKLAKDTKVLHLTSLKQAASMPLDLSINRVEFAAQRATLIGWPVGLGGYGRQRAPIARFVDPWLTLAQCTFVSIATLATF